MAQQTTKKIRIFRNGDDQFPGKNFVCSYRTSKTWNAFLDNVAKEIDTAGPVRGICTPVGGTLVTNLDDVCDKYNYVALGKTPFKPLDYGSLQESANHKFNFSPRKPTSTNDAVSKYRDRYKEMAVGRIRDIQTDSIIIFVYMNGEPQDSPFRAIIQRKSLDNFETVLNEINHRIKLKGKSAKTLYSTDGRKLTKGDELENAVSYVAVSTSDFRGFLKADYGGFVKPKFYVPLKNNGKMTLNQWKSSEYINVRTQKHQFRGKANSYAGGSSASGLDTDSDIQGRHSLPRAKDFANRKKLSYSQQKEKEDIFHAKNLKPIKQSVKQIDFDKDEGGLFKVRKTRDETKGAAVVYENVSLKKRDHQQDIQEEIDGDGDEILPKGQKHPQSVNIQKTSNFQKGSNNPKNSTAEDVRKRNKDGDNKLVHKVIDSNSENDEESYRVELVNAKKIHAENYNKALQSLKRDDASDDDDYAIENKKEKHSGKSNKHDGLSGSHVARSKDKEEHPKPTANGHEIINKRRDSKNDSEDEERNLGKNNNMKRSARETFPKKMNMEDQVKKPVGNIKTTKPDENNKPNKIKLAKKVCKDSDNESSSDEESNKTKAKVVNKKIKKDEKDSSSDSDEGGTKKSKIEKMNKPKIKNKDKKDSSEDEVHIKNTAEHDKAKSINEKNLTGSKNTMHSKIEHHDDIKNKPKNTKSNDSDDEKLQSLKKLGFKKENAQSEEDNHQVKKNNYHIKDNAKSGKPMNHDNKSDDEQSEILNRKPIKKTNSKSDSDDEKLGNQYNQHKKPVNHHPGSDSDTDNQLRKLNKLSANQHSKFDFNNNDGKKSGRAKKPQKSDDSDNDKPKKPMKPGKHDAQSDSDDEKTKKIAKNSAGIMKKEADDADVKKEVATFGGRKLKLAMDVNRSPSQNM